MQTNNRVMPPTTAAAAQPRRMTLAAITRGKVARPAKILIYGIEGIGKSSFGANAPDPIFLDADDGTAQLDVERLPKPQRWQDVLDAIEMLTTEQHPYKTLVVDTLDALEPLCWQHLIEQARKSDIKTIEDFGYGKGYTAALDLWRDFLSRLERMRNQRGIGVIMVAHSWIKPFKDPESDGYDRYEMKLHAKAGGLLREWSDTVLFAQYETFTSKDKNTKRTRGISSGNRVLRTSRTAAYDAKNRFNLPETLPLDYETFAEHVRAHGEVSAESLIAKIEELLVSADETLQESVRAAVQKANGETNKLSRYLDNLSARLAPATQEQGE